MRKILFTALLLLVGTISFGAVVGSPHDLSAALPVGNQQVCVFCHTPHQAAAASAQDPLWNHRASTFAGSYGAYDSATMDHTAGAFGAGAIGSLNSSQLCMSCHDGTTGPGNLYNNPNNSTGGEDTPGAPWAPATMISGNALLGTSLVDDHPVNFTYDSTLDATGLVATAAVPAGWLIGGEVHCASCHNPHDNTFFPFLNATNDGSDLCLGCHLK